MFQYLFNIGALAAAYFLSGLLVLIPDHGEHGVTPLWLPSGVAIYFLLRFGIRFWPGIALGIFLLAAAMEMPVTVAVLAAAGSVLEAVVPAASLRRFTRFRDDLHRISDVVRYVGLVALLGPLFSASLGTFAMTGTAAEIVRTSGLNIAVMWWLGNSLGGLVFGTFLLTWHTVLSTASRIAWQAIALVVALGASIGYLATWVFHGTLSVLLINLLVPVIVYAAIRTGLPGVTTTSLLTGLVVLFSPVTQTGAEVLPDSGIDMNIVALMVVWTNALIGLAVAAAYNEHNASQIFEFLATHDHQTSVFNRAGFIGRLERAIAEARRLGRRHMLLYLDIDNLKVVNERLGHNAGDAMLAELVHRLADTLGERATLARIGGDEFVILLEDADEATGKQLAERLLRAIADSPFNYQDETFRVTASVGLLPITGASGGVEQLMAEADTACYQAKLNGKNGIAMYGEPMF